MRFYMQKNSFSPRSPPLILHPNRNAETKGRVLVEKIHPAFKTLWQNSPMSMPSDRRARKIGRKIVFRSNLTAQDLPFQKIRLYYPQFAWSLTGQWFANYGKQ
jgi:hypothetical protein